MIAWRPLIESAVAILETAAAPYGPIPVVVVRFAGAAVELAIDAAEKKQDPVLVAQQIADRAVDLIEELKLASSPTQPPSSPP